MRSVMDYDPMLLESGLHYPATPAKTLLVVQAKANGVLEDACMEITEAGVMETSPLDLGMSLEHGEVTEIQSPEEHEPDILTQPNGNSGIITQQQQEGSDGGSALIPPIEGSKKRKNWSVPETDLLLEAYISQKTKRKSRLDNERFWEGIAKRVPQRTGTMCRRRMETLMKSYNAVKKHCDKEKKEFSDLNKADFGKLKLACCIREHWFIQIGNHWSPRPTRKSGDQGAASSSTSGCRSSNPVATRVSIGVRGEVGLVPDGFHNSGGVSTDVVTRSGPPTVSQSKAAFGVVRNGAKSSELAWSRRVGEVLMVDFRSRRRHGAWVVVRMLLSWCGKFGSGRSATEV